MHVWNVLHVARWKCRTQKIAKNAPSGHQRTTLSDDIFATKACIDNRKKLLNSNTSSTSSHNTVNFGPLAAEICWRVWGTPVNFYGFRFLAALLHGSLRRWTEGATYIRQGGHHVGHWPTFLVRILCILFAACYGAALRSRCGRYIFVPFLSFFLRLISAVRE